MKWPSSDTTSSYYVTPYLKRVSFLESTWLFKLGFSIATKDASKFLLNLLFCGAFMITFHVKEWLLFFDKWLAGSDFPWGLLCSDQRTSTFRLVSPMYVDPQEQVPLYILHAGWGFLLFKLNSVLIFLVVHFTTIF